MAAKQSKSKKEPAGLLTQQQQPKGQWGIGYAEPSGTMDKSPIIGAEARIFERRTRFQPLQNLSGDYLATCLNAFDIGDLRPAALLWEAMTRRDDILSSVKSKFENDVTRRDWDVIAIDESAAAKRQRDLLKDFWRNVSAVNAFDRNHRGSFAKLVRFMLQARAYRYAGLHIVWNTMGGKLRAEFEYIPLWFFENRSGELRHTLPYGMTYFGEALDPQNWLVCANDGIMEACSVAYMFKVLAIGDWLAFSEKFGLPFPYIEAPQGVRPDMPEWDALVDVATQIQAGNAAVITAGSKPGFLSASAGDMPMPAIVERSDRFMSAMWRGSDLSTMSQKSEARGSSVQERETLIICADACAWVSEELKRVSALVLEWHGEDPENPLAYLQLRAPVTSDTNVDLAVDNALIRWGIPMDRRSVAERYERSIAPDGTPDDQLIKAPQSSAPAREITAANEAPAAASVVTDDIRAAMRADLQPLFTAIETAMQRDGTITDEQWDQVIDDVLANGGNIAAALSTETMKATLAAMGFSAADITDIIAQAMTEN